MISVETVSSEELRAAIDDLARLRIEVFREYPYLYDGDPEYEKEYLETYVSSPHAMAALALDEHRKIVGASTGVPMAHETEAFKAPFAAAGIDTDTLFYYGESVLLPRYRGQGVYRQFFEHRAAYARRLGEFDQVCFCAVVRADDHPLRPAGYRPLDDIWTRFGFAPRPDLTTFYPWKDLDQPAQTDHRMMFWLKRL